jgi:hypothetical protein
MESKAFNAVTAAVLADAAFDAVGEATKFSTQRYRQIIEQICQTGELPQAWRPARRNRRNAVQHSGGQKLPEHVRPPGK